ncbi:hypothetical protein [Cylindrospermum sp. FACHB-282]|uniref:hypothetical protein n=1 Tax=Cylindrospermum sp. FACHB-282 TaxID=2692794 RepID=UPI001688EB88|nr:hypothetical protein [Cylindrospermum sp. FACHB-282]MBD2386931.1 hypothetical protein [Cylindrospermum sp. FACHB-282]
MTTNVETFLIQKEDYVLSILSFGVAVQMLQGVTGGSRDELSSYIAQQAMAQLDELTPEQIQKAVDGYFQAKALGKDGTAYINYTTGDFKFHVTA